MIPCAIGVLAIAWYKKVPIMRTVEVGAPAVAGAYAVGRTGCWAVGDDYGRPWDGPIATVFPEGAPPSTAGIMAREFGVTFPPGTDPGTLVSVHPTQLYESLFHAACAGLFAIALHRNAFRGEWFRGNLFKAYIILYAAFRFGTELLRPEPRFLAGLTGYQWGSIVLAAAFGWLWWRDARRIRDNDSCGSPSVA